MIPLLLDKWWYANNILIRVEQKLDNILVRGRRLDNILVGEEQKLEVPSL